MSFWEECLKTGLRSEFHGLILSCWLELSYSYTEVILIRVVRETVSDSVWFTMPRLLSHDWLNKTPFIVCAGYHGDKKHWTSMKLIRNCDSVSSETYLLCGDFLISLDSRVSFGKAISKFAPTSMYGHRCPLVICMCKLAFSEANKGESFV